MKIHKYFYGDNICLNIQISRSTVAYIKKEIKLKDKNT